MATIYFGPIPSQSCQKSLEQSRGFFTAYFQQNQLEILTFGLRISQ